MCFLVISLTLITLRWVLLVYTCEVTAGRKSQNPQTRCQGIIISSLHKRRPILSTRPVTGYSTTDGKLWAPPPHTLQSRCHTQGFHLFECFTTHLAVKWFATAADVKQAVTSSLQTLDVSVGQMLRHQWWLYKVWCVPSATRMPRIHRSQK
jgi:hypothetical protein